MIVKTEKKKKHLYGEMEPSNDLFDHLPYGFYQEYGKGFEQNLKHKIFSLSLLVTTYVYM